MQPCAVIFTPRAERQLADLYSYIVETNGEALADNYVSKIVAACTTLSTFPERGRKRTIFVQTCGQWFSPNE